MTNTTGTHLNHLNDDCLLEIFSVKSLTRMDLCSLAETCTRFERIARRVFPKDLKIKIRSNESYDFVSRNYWSNGHRPSHNVERIFKNFGSCLSQVSILGNYSGESSKFVLNLVAEYCVDSLDSLRIHIPAVLIVEFQPIFKRLQILQLDGVSIEEYDQTLFADLNSLIELRVWNVKNDSAILDNIFPKLERFTYCRGTKFRIDHLLSTFISRHRSLQMLELNINIPEWFKMTFLQVIGNSCKDLEKLVLYLGLTNSSSLQPLQAFQSLKTLKLCCLSCDDFKLIPAMPTLRELHLYECRLPTDPNQFTALAQLTNLHIIGGTHGASMLAIIRRLTNLEEFTIERELDEETFSNCCNS